MPTSQFTRNLRDGELVILDGAATPKSLTILLDEGDLTWTQRQKTIEIKDRGSITAGHTRPGDDESVSLSFTARWTQLLSRSVNSSDPLALYETLMFAEDAGVVSTSQAGEQQTLTLQFTVLDPAGIASERITFEKVYRESLTMSEGNDSNSIAFSGKAFQTAPTVTRI
ncbi:MAG: hypothetical protein ACK5Q5_20020 [Planctomycetaceae bacterium]